MRAVCANSIDGIVCALCGFATCMVLEFGYMLWLIVAVIDDAVLEQLGFEDVLWTLLYSVVPYLTLLAIRCYTLVKAQAFRRSLQRNKAFRARVAEDSQLLRGK